MNEKIESAVLRSLESFDSVDAIKTFDIVLSWSFFLVFEKTFEF